MKARDVMSSPVITLRPDVPVHLPARPAFGRHRLRLQHHLHHLLQPPARRVPQPVDGVDVDEPRQQD